MFRDCFQHLSKIERRRIVTADNTVMRLNRGERPEQLPFGLQREIRIALGGCGSTIQQYPSYQEFYNQLGRYICFPKEQIVVGAGIEEFIRTLMFLCCDPGQKAVVLWPTCAMYDIYAQAFGVDLVRVKPQPGIKFKVSDFLSQIPNDVRVVFVPNPGQPVETHFTNLELGVLADYCNDIGAVLAVDEAHYGFGSLTAFPLIERHPNLLVMRTFSKALGAASIRVGYVVGQQSIIRVLDAVRPSGEVTGPSMAVATVLMNNHELLAAEACKIAVAREWLRDSIHKLKYRAFGQYGFSVLVEFNTRQQMQWVVAKLANSGIYIKGGFPEPVQYCALIACGTLPLMEKFFEIFKILVKHSETLKFDDEIGVMA